MDGQTLDEEGRTDEVERDRQVRWTVGIARWDKEE